jgi:hypothetical protein
MSGSGGGGGGGGPATPDAQVDCTSLIFRTNLNSPDPAVVSELNRRDVLQVSPKTPQGPIEVIANAGKVAGSITAAQMMRLLQCINDGFEYVAVVLSISGGRVEVEVRPKSK